MKRSISLLFVLFSIGLQAQIINIPTDYTSIQEGIDNANIGDTVLVAPGIYYENLVIETKSIVLASHFLFTQDTSYISHTIIDGDSLGSCITITGVNDTNSIPMISGFTIRNGHWFGGYGGGIYCTASNFVLDHLIIENCSAFAGGGIYINGGYLHISPLIQNSIIRNNNVYYAEGEPGYGAGICSWPAGPHYQASPTLINVVIENNQANLPHPNWVNNYTWGLGGGIYGSGYLDNVTIRNNQATEGGGIYGYVFIENSVIVNNKGYGGGMYIPGGTTELLNVTIAQNDTLGTNDGGGIVCEYGNLTITNSILHNAGSIEIQCLDFGISNNLITVLFSNIRNGESGILLTPNDTLNWLQGNISAQPRFLDTSINDFSLSPGSPCIDAGTPDTSGLQLPEFDLAGNPRIWNNRIDIGAYEWNNVGFDKPLSEKSQKSVYFFPNPADESITISPADFREMNKIDLYNLQGQKVFSSKAHSNYLNLSSFPSGVYFIRFYTPKNSFTEKLIIQ